VEGHNCALELEKLFSKNHHSLRTIAEIGIGTHDTAILTGNSFEDRKVRGVLRIGIGKVSDEGGQKSPIRLDGILFQPSVWIDDKIFIDHGNHL
jgi:leucyl aminopeptidase (aminopeptidase T)